jgi:hypothetical protein
MWINNKIAFVHMRMKFPSAFGGYFININIPSIEKKFLTLRSECE